MSRHATPTCGLPSGVPGHVGGTTVAAPTVKLSSEPTAEGFSKSAEKPSEIARSRASKEAVPKGSGSPPNACSPPPKTGPKTW